MPAACPPDWIVPDWPVPSCIKAVFTTRQGGASAAPWDSLNLGLRVGDDAAHVAANRQRVQQALGVTAVYMHQVHGTAVQVHALADAATRPLATADACITPMRGLACAIQVADCLPVLLADATGQWVAAAHAGWRGLAGVEMLNPGMASAGGAGGKRVGKGAEKLGKGVLEQLFISIQALAKVDYVGEATNIVAWLGPCIGPQAFEVGPEVKQAFEVDNPQAGRHFRPLQPGSSQFMADLAGLARQRLEALGVHQVYGNDGSAAWCTYSNPSRFFSHRRDGVRLGASGRHGAFIWCD